MTRVIPLVASGLIGLLAGCTSYERYAIPPNALIDLYPEPIGTAYFPERLDSFLEEKGIADASERARLIKDSGIAYGQSVSERDVDIKFSTGRVDKFGLSDLVDDEEEEVIDTEPRQSLDTYGARGAKFYPLSNIPFIKATLKDVQTLASQYEGLSTIPMD